MRHRRILTDRLVVRLSREEKELLCKLCDARGEGVSDFVRRAVRREVAIELALLGYLKDREPSWRTSNETS